MWSFRPHNLALEGYPPFAAALGAGQDHSDGAYQSGPGIIASRRACAVPYQGTMPCGLYRAEIACTCILRTSGRVPTSTLGLASCLTNQTASPTPSRYIPTGSGYNGIPSDPLVLPQHIRAAGSAMPFNTLILTRPRRSLICVRQRPLSDSQNGSAQMTLNHRERPLSDILCIEVTEHAASVV